MTQTHYTWPITPARLRAASRLLRDLRKKGAVFTLHRDREGFGLHTPKHLPITEEMNAQVQFFGPEILELLRREKRAKRNLAIEP